MGEQQKLILVIDDDSVSLNHVVQLLQNSGFSAIGASNGLDGLKELQSHYPKLIVLDINMPELDGMQTCRMIRAHEKHKTTPILMLTARGDITDMMEARKMGADDYLVKPIDDMALLRKVQRLFAR